MIGAGWSQFKRGIPKQKKRPRKKGVEEEGKRSKWGVFFPVRHSGGKYHRWWLVCGAQFRGRRTNSRDCHSRICPGWKRGPVECGTHVLRKVVGPRFFSFSAALLTLGGDGAVECKAGSALHTEVVSWGTSLVHTDDARKGKFESG